MYYTWGIDYPKQICIIVTVMPKKQLKEIKVKKASVKIDQPIQLVDDDETDTHVHDSDIDPDVAEALKIKHKTKKVNLETVEYFAELERGDLEEDTIPEE